MDNQNNRPIRFDSEEQIRTVVSQLSDEGYSSKEISIAMVSIAPTDLDILNSIIDELGLKHFSNLPPEGIAISDEYLKEKNIDGLIDLLNAKLNIYLSAMKFTWIKYQNTTQI